MKTDTLIDHLSQFHPKGYDLSLGRISELLDKLGQPQHKLPPTFHVAGTNGKGSVIANLRSILEANGWSVHSHISPHLVNYHERYRIAHTTKGASSNIVSDDMLAEALARVAHANDGGKITVFELLAATMFVLFSEQPADYALVEVGLGGRFDGTNVLTNPLVCVITPVSLDHQSYLGDTLGKIAFEKAGIIKAGCPVVIGPQPDEARQVLEDIAHDKKCTVMIAGQDFDYYEEAGRFIYQDGDGLFDLPLPALLGEHQLSNSALAIAATRLGKCNIDVLAFEKAMGNLHWPGRFERLAPGNITAKFKKDAEIWIDGGHNGGAGAVISRELTGMNEKSPKQLVMICAMLSSKDPQYFFKQFLPHNPQIFTVPITTSEHGIDARELVAQAQKSGLDAQACASLEEALSQARKLQGDNRILIAGSLYLVGEILKKNGTLPV